jgi:hypothetical protein
MQVVTQVWRREFEKQTTTTNTTMNTTITLNVLLTSESRKVFQEQQEFLHNTALQEATSPFPFRMVMSIPFKKIGDPIHRI